MQKSSNIELQYGISETTNILIENNNCDKNDYMIAVFCGAIAGLIDSFFVGKPNINSSTTDSLLGKEVDKISENLVEKFADTCLVKDKKTYSRIADKLSKENLGKREFNKRLKEELVKCGIPENFSIEKEYIGMRGNQSKLTYLENKFRVSYDQSTSDKIAEEITFSLTPDNHHLKSLSHWPDLIGLFFSILDQFTGKTTFISNGTLYRVTPSQRLPVLRGETFTQKLFFGFVNWFGHLLSDFCGSHSSKGRGDGIPIPFFGVFLGCNFGSFTYSTKTAESSLTISELAIKVYEHGYDARFGATMAIPVVLQDLMIRFLWSLKTHFVHKLPWNQCVPSTKHKDLRMMLLTGNATLCIIDGSDALIRSHGGLMEFILHFNLIAWYRLCLLAFKEVCIRAGITHPLQKQCNSYILINEALKQYIAELEKIDIQQFQTETARYRALIANLEHIDNEDELTQLLKQEYVALGIMLPYQGDFNSFMNDGDAHLVFQ